MIELEERLLEEKRLTERLDSELSILKVVPLIIGERFSNDLSILRVSSGEYLSNNLSILRLCSTVMGNVSTVSYPYSRCVALIIGKRLSNNLSILGVCSNDYLVQVY